MSCTCDLILANFNLAFCLSICQNKFPAKFSSNTDLGNKPSHIDNENSQSGGIVESIYPSFQARQTESHPVATLRTAGDFVRKTGQIVSKSPHLSSMGTSQVESVWQGHVNFCTWILIHKRHPDNLPIDYNFNHSLRRNTLNMLNTNTDICSCVHIHEARVGAT